MKITLTNFKCHAHLELEIPKGVVLLSGENGKGKSTIMHAIFWCLYGEKKNVTTYGKNKTKVVLEMPGLTIERSKPPHDLKVTNSEGTFEGDIAQEIINRYMGCGKEIFEVSCYIRQKHKFSSILSFGDQGSILEQLSDKGNIDLFIEKIKRHQKYLKSKIEDTRKNIISVSKPEKVDEPEHRAEEEELIESKKQIEMLKKRCEVLSEKCKVEHAKKMAFSLKSTRIQEIKTRLDEVTREYKKFLEEDEDFSDYRDFFTSLARYESLRESRLKDLGVFLQKTKNMREPSLIQKEIDLTEKIIQKKETLSSEGARIQKEIANLYTKMRLEVDGLPSACSEKNVKSFLENYSVEYETLNCPCCEKDVYYDGLKLNRKRGGAKGDNTLPRQVFWECKGLAEEILKKYSEIRPDTTPTGDYYSKKAELLKEYRDSNTAFAMVDMKKNPGPEEKRLARVVEGGTDLTKDQYDDLMRKNSFSAEMKLKYSEEIKELKKKIALLGKPEPDEYEETLALSEKSASKLARLHVYHEQLLAARTETILYDTYKTHREHYDKIMAGNSKAEKSIKSLEKESLLVENILEKSLRAEVKIHSSILDLINRKAKYHLKNLFDYPVKVRLVNSKEEKLKINVKIETKGIPISDLENLGGGERERIELAFCLALNEIGNSKKILLFDESFSGVHAEAFTKSVEYIKTLYKKIPVLIISQHYHEGCFEKVIRI